MPVSPSKRGVSKVLMGLPLPEEGEGEEEKLKFMSDQIINYLIGENLFICSFHNRVNRPPPLLSRPRALSAAQMTLPSSSLRCLRASDASPPLLPLTMTNKTKPKNSE